MIENANEYTGNRGYPGSSNVIGINTNKHYPNGSDSKPRRKTVPPVSGGTGNPAATTIDLWRKPVNKELEQFRFEVLAVADEVAEIVIKKQNDYGPNNIRRSPFGPINGLAVRLYDKVARLANLSQKKEAPSNESVRDTFIDIAGYGLIGLMILDGTFPKEN